MQNRWTPPGNIGKNIPYPLPWIFNPCASMMKAFTKDLSLILGKLACFV